MKHLHNLKPLLRMGGGASLGRRLHRYFQILTTFILLATIRLGLWLLPFQTLLQGLEKLGRATSLSLSINPSFSISHIVWRVNVSSRYLPGVKCLARALATQVLLTRHGYPSELQIGVAKSEHGELEAHAWVEYQGRVIIGGLSTLSRFVPLPRLNLIQK
jgi:Transglutaminase-like superfamily